MPRRSLKIRVLSALARATDPLPDAVMAPLSGRPPIEVDGQRLDAGVQLLLASREWMGEPPVDTLTVDRGRAFTREEAAIARGRGTAVGAVHERTVAGALGPLRARHYVPDEPFGPHPLIVF